MKGPPKTAWVALDLNHGSTANTTNHAVCAARNERVAFSCTLPGGGTRAACHMTCKRRLLGSSAGARWCPRATTVASKPKPDNPKAADPDLPAARWPSTPFRRCHRSLCCRSGRPSTAKGEGPNACFQLASSVVGTLHAKRKQR